MSETEGTNRAAPLSAVHRLRELSENAVGGDLLPPAWAEFVSLVPAALTEMENRAKSAEGNVRMEVAKKQETHRRLTETRAALRELVKVFEYRQGWPIPPQAEETLFALIHDENTALAIARRILAGEEPESTG